MQDPAYLVADAEARALYRMAVDIRDAIDRAAELVNGLRHARAAQENGEAIANIELSYRHLEDASARLGKTLHALERGPRSTGVIAHLGGGGGGGGAPEATRRDATGTNGRNTQDPSWPPNTQDPKG